MRKKAWIFSARTLVIVSPGREDWTRGGKYLACDLRLSAIVSGIIAMSFVSMCSGAHLQLSRDRRHELGKNVGDKNGPIQSADPDHSDRPPLPH